ncbi:hypothetical protein VTK56DRAFT_472 [Thermocarpiscus australiensis]
MSAVPEPGPRKRSRSPSGELGRGGSADRPAKHVKCGHEPRDGIVKHALLMQYYPAVQTLRQYLISKLPASSRIRRRKIASVGLAQPPPEKSLSEDELAVGKLLDTTIVASHDRVQDSRDGRWEQWVGFSQKGDEPYVTLSDGLRGSTYSQSEIVDFVIWLLFSRERAVARPKHLLCDGFRRQAGSNSHGNPPVARTTIPGLYSVYPNQHERALKESPWPQLLMLLGKEGERIMIDLLVDCAIFTTVKAGKGNLYQLSGIPISELEVLPAVANKADPSPSSADLRNAELRPSEITFVRSRMLYARAALNARGLVHFGLRHIHVLNRFPYKGASAQVDRHDPSVVHILMYMFPRQFGLHNVFTSTVNRQQTAQKFQDYTLREEGIANNFPAAEAGGKPTMHVPKRLRGTAMHLVQRLQILHKRCSYAEMLQHYCPVPEQIDGPKKGQAASSKVLPLSSRPSSKSVKAGKKSRQSTSSAPDFHYTSLTELATPVSSVSAFCQAVMSKVIPNDFWGQVPSIQEHNKACFLKKVHHFIHLRRFESMCLHEVMQGMKVRDIEWLTPPGLGNQKSCLSDMRKRTEIFYEFLYYLFDSFLIPLIRSNFYVTESSVHRYRLFFFRHDVWRYVAEPAMAVLKTKMFEEVRTEDALQILQSRRLGFSQVRLLPKQMTMRPIMNLRRRTLLQGNKKILGPSINSILGPVSSVLKLEKTRNSNRLGSSMFSVGEIYQRIKSFKSRLGDGHHDFYFAKVDVQAAFDTIPQDAVMELMKQILRQSNYKLAKHVEVCLLEMASGGGNNVKASKRWHTVAKAAGDTKSFPQMVEESLAAKRRNTVFVDSAAQQNLDTRELLALMAAHVEQNLVRIGKKYYRQKSGIPQGSVLSSMLCNYFYADLERNHLSFLQANDCLLLRLIDDFMLITTDKGKARRFVETMHRGLPRYGVTVNPEKSLTNFPLTLQGFVVARPNDSRKFPYCGLLVDCRTLEVSKQRENPKDPAVIFNSLTVEYSRRPGRNFKRKAINAIKMQSHLIFFDTSHNSRRAVLANIYSAFVETAAKMWAYARCMAGRPSAAVWIDTIKTVVDVAFALLTSRARRERFPGYVCGVQRAEVAWLAMVACRQVLVRKQAGYKEVIAWLEEETRKLSSKKSLDVEGLVGVAKAQPMHRRVGKV